MNNRQLKKKIHKFINYGLTIDPSFATRIQIMKEDNPDFDLEYEVGNYIYTAFNCMKESFIQTAVARYKWTMDDDTIYWKRRHKHAR